MKGMGDKLDGKEPQFDEQAQQQAFMAFQRILGAKQQEAAAKAQAAGLEVMMNRCMKIEFARMFGGLNFIGVNTQIISAKRPLTLPY